MDYKLIKSFNKLMKEYYGVDGNDCGMTNLEIERWCEGWDVETAVVEFGIKHDLDRVDMGW